MAWTRLRIRKELGGMGFRTLREFNLALLAKQEWRLLNSNSSSLVFQLYKAKYFPNCHFLQASLG